MVQGAALGQDVDGIGVHGQGAMGGNGGHDDGNEEALMIDDDEVKD